MDRTILPPLRDLLATFYRDEPNIKRIVDDVGLDASRLDFNGSAQGIWHAVLHETEQQQKLDVLLAIVEKDYNSNQEFQTLYQRYHQASRSEQVLRALPTYTTKSRSGVLALSLILLLTLLSSNVWYQRRQASDTSDFNSPNSETLSASSTFTVTATSEGTLTLTPVPMNINASVPVEQSETVTSTLVDATPARPIPTIAVRRAGGVRRISLTPIPSVEQ